MAYLTLLRSLGNKNSRLGLRVATLALSHCTITEDRGEVPGTELSKPEQDEDEDHHNDNEKNPNLPAYFH